MLRALLYIYAALFTFVHAAAFRQSLKDREPVYRVVLAAATSLFVLAGILAYALGAHRNLSTVWRVLGPPFVATYLWLAATEVREIFQHRDQELTPGEDRVTSIIGLVLAILILGPGLWLNFLVAKGSQAN